MLKADLDRARAKHRLGGDDLAVLLGVHPRKLFSIERGHEPAPRDFRARLATLLEASDLSSLELESKAGATAQLPWPLVAKNMVLGILGSAFYWFGQALESGLLRGSLMVVGGAMIVVFAFRGRKLGPVCSECGSRADRTLGFCEHCGVSFMPDLRSVRPMAPNQGNAGAP